MSKIDSLLESVFADEWRQAAGGALLTELKCWDSLHYVQWVVGVQATFKIELTQNQILKIISVAGLREVLKDHGIQA